MKRSFFFIRDSLTKQYYIDSRDSLGNFVGAVTFANRKNAEKGIRDRIGNWEHNNSFGKVKKSDPSYDYCMERYKEAKLRKNLTNWGMEVIEVSVEEPA